MPNQQIPDDAPPSYQQATGGSSRPVGNNAGGSFLNVPGAPSSSSSNGISPSQRRSMEDELRPLPSGWVRTYDTSTHHQFFVNTSVDPPRSIWHHPYDDEDYLSTLSSEERERIEQESMHRGQRPSKADIMAAHSDDDEEHVAAATTSTSPLSGQIPAELPPRPAGSGKGKQPDTRTFGRKFKDKVTGTTHEQREAERKRRAEEERELYAKHMRIRQAMAEAAQTGRPVKIGQDRNGKDVFIDPPPQQPYGYGPYSGGYGYNGPFNNPGPYNSGGMYATPNGRYIRPAGPYARPGGSGYGGGYGLPLAIGGGLLGGLLLGDALF